MRAAIYARYSSDNQRDASIEDQVRACRARIGREGWSPVATYSDRAVSGASRLRPGYQRLLEDARTGRFDVVVAEALDRLSRDQEDTAALHKHLAFAGVRLITLVRAAAPTLPTANCTHMPPAKDTICAKRALNRRIVQPRCAQNFLFAVHQGSLLRHLRVFEESNYAANGRSSVCRKLRLFVQKSLICRKP